VKAAQEWLAAAKTMKGGKNLEAYVYFPVAVNNLPETDLIFVVSAPTFKELGAFWDAFKDSPVAKLDKANRKFIVAPNSGIWESIKVKPPSGTVAPTSAMKATQMWKCELHDDATEEQVVEAAEKWLAAAKTMKGGKNLDAYVYFPVAVNNNGESDLIFVVVAPSFTEWGEFWDGYKGSPAAKLDKEHQDFIVPTDSGLWESIKAKTPSAPAAAGKATQMWRCELDDDATEDQVVEAAEKWLAAAKTMNGGKDLEAFVYFPIAVNDSGQSDMFFVVRAPSFKVWGMFWDGFKDSPAAKLDKGNRDFIVPTDSGLWESIKIE
jgi:G:T-mismatch repair DNA endonuclease (very short patch repair protein)